MTAKLTRFAWSWVKRLPRTNQRQQKARSTKREPTGNATPGITVAMQISPVTLEGQHTRLEPLTLAHQEALIAAAGDGELWNSTVTVVAARDTMTEYINEALKARARGTELPFVII